MFARRLVRSFSQGQPIELGYYNIKGLLEPSRWICHHYKLDFVEWNPKSEHDWEIKKKELGPMASLPYLKDGDFILCETTNVPRCIPYYLAHKAGHPEFMGEDGRERAEMRMLESMLDDIRVQCFDIIKQGPGFDHQAALKQLFDKSGPAYQKLVYLSAKLGDREFFFNHLTWLDFMMQFTTRFCSAIMYSQFGHTPFADFPNIVALLARVSSLEGVKARLDFAQPVEYLDPKTVPFKLMSFKAMIDAGLKPI